MSVNFTLQKLRPAIREERAPTNSSDFFKYSGTFSKFPKMNNGRFIKPWKRISVTLMKNIFESVATLNYY